MTALLLPELSGPPMPPLLQSSMPTPMHSMPARPHPKLPVLCEICGVNVTAGHRLCRECEIDEEITCVRPRLDITDPLPLDPDSLLWDPRHPD